MKVNGWVGDEWDRYESVRFGTDPDLDLSVADPEFHNGGGGRSRWRGLGRRLCPFSRKKLNFYLKMVGFGAF